MAQDNIVPPDPRSVVGSHSDPDALTFEALAKWSDDMATQRKIITAAEMDRNQLVGFALDELEAEASLMADSPRVQLPEAGSRAGRPPGFVGDDCKVGVQVPSAPPCDVASHRQGSEPSLRFEFLAFCGAGSRAKALTV